MGTPLRAAFGAQLHALEQRLQDEARLVVRSLGASLSALRRQDAVLADEVIAFDDDVDAAYLSIEEGIQDLLARQTPVAADLRLVLAMMHVNLHLERMADLCVTVAKLAKLTRDLPADQSLVAGFDEMAARAEEMVRVGMEAFAERDRDKAESLVAMDELIDRANRRVVEQVLELGGHPEMREWGIRMIVVSRSLERFGDHAVDIGEQVAYLVTGTFREFTDASHPDATEPVRPGEP